MRIDLLAFSYAVTRISCSAEPTTAGMPSIAQRLPNPLATQATHTTSGSTNIYIYIYYIFIFICVYIYSLRYISYAKV